MKMNPLDNKSYGRFYSAERIGGGIKEVDITYAGTGPQKIVSHWYHGSDGVDLFIWIDSKGNVIKQQLNLAGSIVEWNILDGLRTGMVIEVEMLMAASSDMAQGASPKSSESILFDSSPSQFTIKFASEIIPHVPGLDEALRQTLIQHFLKPKSFSHLQFEEIVRRYGGQSEGRIKFLFKSWIKKFFS